MALVLVIAIFSFALRASWIVGSLPYPRHVDEATFSRSSLNMLREGTLRPTEFNWPTFPIYLAAAASGAALVWKIAAKRIESRGEVSLRVFPHYQDASLILPAKLLFAAISVATLLLVGFIASRVSGSRWAWVLAPTILSSSLLYIRYSWAYLNVDIIATFLVVAALAYLLRDPMPEEGWAKRVVVPGVLCGLAVASKYTQALLVIPFLISLFLSDRKRSVVAAAVLALTVAVTFAIAMPYSLLDFDQFFHWLGVQQSIYSSGWPGYEVEPGLPHLARQLEHLAEYFGPVAFGFGSFGLAHTLLRRSPSGIALASYPIVFLLFYSTYRVDFVRNLLPVHALFSAFAAIGVVVVARSTLGWLVSRDWPPGCARGREPLVAVAVVATLVLAAPWSRVSRAYSNPPDSRNLALAWIRGNLAPGSRLVFARELGFDTRALESDYSIITRAFGRKSGEENQEVAPDPAFFAREAEAEAVFVTPIYGFDERWPERRTIAEDLNATFGGGEELARFGAVPVRVRHFEPVPVGDPSFSLRRGQVVVSTYSAPPVRLLE